MSGKPEIEQMLRTIQRECEYTVDMTGISAFQSNVMDAMATVPREEFVPEEMKPYAYNNSPLPIGNGQTISQPYIVALMTNLLWPYKNKVILEVGTGSGYQAAILAKLVKKVHSLEIIPALTRQAKERLERLGYDNVNVIQGDGYMGFPQHAPYDGIIVTAAAGHIPPPLKEQLKPGGRMVIPVGQPYSIQHLMLITKDANGECTTEEVLAVSFVPLTGGGMDKLKIDIKVSCYAGYRGEETPQRFFLSRPGRLKLSKFLTAGLPPTIDILKCVATMELYI